MNDQCDFDIGRGSTVLERSCTVFGITQFSLRGSNISSHAVEVNLVDNIYKMQCLSLTNISFILSVSEIWALLKKQTFIVSYWTYWVITCIIFLLQVYMWHP